MGVTIKCKKTGDSIDMGGFGFFLLRRKVSDLCGEPWAAHYRKLTDSVGMHNREWYDAFDRETLDLIERKAIKIKIADFLLQTDITGSIHYGACKMLLKVIGDYDDNIPYGYSGRADFAMFRDFKKLLRLCVENKCDLVWY